MRQITYRIQRFDGEKSYMQEYLFPYEPGKTVLWGLIQIKENIDATLTFVAACRSAVCGACAVRVNGHALLACEVALDDLLPRLGDVLDIAPLSNFTVLRDLVVDWEPKVERLKEVNPWLLPKQEFTAQTGCRQSPAEFKRIQKQAECILCGACASECNKLSVGAADFYEPFIYAKAQKFVADSRDGEPLTHLEPAMQQGTWKCVHCQECVSKCPKGLEPAEDISRLRRTAIQKGLIDNPGARHALAFAHDIRTTGRLDEPGLALKTEGMFKSMLRLPVAFRLLRRGKMNPLQRHGAIKGIETVRAIMDAVKEGK